MVVVLLGKSSGRRQLCQPSLGAPSIDAVGIVAKQALPNPLFFCAAAERGQALCAPDQGFLRESRAPARIGSELLLGFSRSAHRQQQVAE